MKYKINIGDLVIPKKRPYYEEIKRKLIGTICTVSYVDENNNYRLKEDKNQCIWNQDELICFYSGDWEYVFSKENINIKENDLMEVILND